MEETVENILSILREYKKRLTATCESIDSVTNSVGAILDRFYKKDSVYKKKIEKLSNDTNTVKNTIFMFPKNSLGQNDYIESYKKETESLIDNMILEIERFGLPTTQDIKVDKSINVTNTLNQNQQQTQNINLKFVLEVLRNELSGRQFKEIENIVTQENDPEIAKPKIIEKLNSFGASMLSSMLANILTNPAIWSLFLQNIVGG